MNSNIITPQGPGTHVPGQRRGHPARHGGDARRLASSAQRTKEVADCAAGTPTSRDLVAATRGWRAQGEAATAALFTERFFDLVESLAATRSATVCAVDETTAGGVHAAWVSVDLDAALVTVELPEVPDGRDAGAALPTVCHALEIVALAVLRLGVTTPRLNWVTTGAARTQDHSGDTVVMPLTIDPQETNALVFHTQSRSFEPVNFAASWWRVITDPRFDFGNSLIRHTMLLRPRSAPNANIVCAVDPPFPPSPDKLSVRCTVMPHTEARDSNRFRLLHLGAVGQWRLVPDHDEVRWEDDQTFVVLRPRLSDLPTGPAEDSP